MSDGTLDRRIELDGSVVEIERVDGALVVVRRSADGSVERHDPSADPVLPGLGAVLDPDRRAEVVERALGGTVPVIDTTLVRYRAGRRATLRMVLDGGDGDRHIVFAKVFHDPRKAKTTATSLAHLEARLAAGADVALPRLLGHDPVTACVFLGALEGAPMALPDPGREPGVTAAEFRRFGAALGALHELPRGPLPARPTDRRLDATRARILQLGGGPLATDLSAALDDVIEFFGRAAEPEATVVHGDCKPAQVLLGERLALLDPDHLGWGDPAGDVADLRVAVRQHALRTVSGDGDEPDDATAGAIGAFERGYADARPGRFDDAFAARVERLERLGLVRKALRAESRSPGTDVARRLVSAAAPR